MACAVRFPEYALDRQTDEIIHGEIAYHLNLDYAKRSWNLFVRDASVETFCRKWMIIRLEQFGSALRKDFNYASDLDFLVTFDTSSRWSLLDFVAMEHELEANFGRKVDLIERRVIEQSDNWIRRKEILGSARDYYVA